MEKLHKNILRYAGLELADKIVYTDEQIAMDSRKAKKNWVEHVSRKLEKSFNVSEIKKIRMGCYRDENGKLEKSKKSSKIQIHGKFR